MPTIQGRITKTEGRPMFRTADEVRRASQAEGSHMFDPETMKLFSSRLSNYHVGIPVHPDETHTLAWGLVITSDKTMLYDTPTRGYMPRVYWQTSTGWDWESLNSGPLNGGYKSRRDAERAAQQYVDAFGAVTVVPR